MTAARRQAFRWGFLTAFPALLGVALYAELLVFALQQVRLASGPGLAVSGGLLFAVLVGPFALLVYRFPLVFDFFRSIKVGIANLVLIGLAAIAGVLFHQEDPNAPIAPQSRAGDLHEVSPARYRDYLAFREAHAYFTFKLIHGGIGGWAFHGLLPGVPERCEVAERAASNESKMEALLAAFDAQGVAARFGEEFAVGQIEQSRAGLQNRAEAAEIAAFESQWADAWWTLFHYADELDFVRVYQADWFASFWVVLLGGVISNTFRGGWRRLLRPTKWGFVMAHSGVVLLILGAFLGFFFEQRGLLNLNIGRTLDEFQRYSGKIEKFVPPLHLGEDPPPFRVRLDAFRADLHDVLDVHYAVMDPEGGVDFEYQLRSPRFRVYRGQTLYFDYGEGDATFLAERRDPEQVPHLRLEVLDYVPQAELRPVLGASPPGALPGPPMVHLRILGADGHVEQDQVLSGPESGVLVHGASGSRIRFVAVAAEAEARQRLAATLPDHYGHVVRRSPGIEGELARVPVRPGARFELDAEGARYQIEVLEALPFPRLRQDDDGRWVHVPFAERIELLEPRHPAALLRIVDASGESEERWVFQSSFLNQAGRFADLDLAFEWDPWSAPAVARYLVFLLPTGEEVRVLAGELGRPDTLSTFPLAGALPLDQDHRLVLAAAELHGNPETEIGPVEGADFFDPSPAAIRLRATTPEGSQELVMSTDQDGNWLRYAGPGGAPRLVKLQFHEDTDDLPFEWQSKLSFFRGAGSPAKSGHVRVNDYEYFDGYRFFQSNWRKEDPTYSGIGIVYDPGLEIVLAGLYLVAVGAIVSFLVVPLITKRHRGV